MSAAPGSGWDAGLQHLTGAGEPPSLLQSWGFGRVQAEEGWRVARLALPGSRASVLLQGSGLFARAYVPRGPVPTTSESLAALAGWARERGLARLRVEPDGGTALADELRSLGFVPSVGMQPEHTLIVPLGSEEAMMASFKPKHRYNIRLASRRGVEVEEDDDVAELERQTRATARRQGISLPGLAGYRRRLAELDWCRVYVARHEGRALAAIMVARFAGRGYYLFGGSSGERRELQPTYAVQWAAMRAAAEAGCRDYDLWGVPPKGDPSHPWAGLWQFKVGFGGRLVDYCGAWDLPLSPRIAHLGDAVSRLGRLRHKIFTS